MTAGRSSRGESSPRLLRHDGEECAGRRFQALVLEYRFGGLNFAEGLDLPIAEAGPFFSVGEAKAPAAHAILRRMADVGLGYLRLGQPLTTLSGAASASA